MKKLSILFCSAALVALVKAADPVSLQDAQVAAAIKEVQAQQAQMAANQARIEEKLAIVAEAMRVARIYASRAGNAAGD